LSDIIEQVENKIRGGILMNKTMKEDVSIVLSGEAGQGIQTIERLLTFILKS